MFVDQSQQSFYSLYIIPRIRRRKSLKRINGLFEFQIYSCRLTVLAAAAESFMWDARILPVNGAYRQISSQFSAAAHNLVSLVHNLVSAAHNLVSCRAVCSQCRFLLII